jgi:hypothetical protein
MYDFLITSDFMVPDPDRQADLVIKHLGVHGHPKWRWMPESATVGGRRIQVDTDQLDSSLIEFVEWQPRA